MKSILVLPLLFLFGITAKAQQTIALVEQFAGFKSVYSSVAMDQMVAMENQFQDSVIFVNMHAGPMSEPNLTGSVFLMDLTIPQSYDYYQFSNLMGVPAAMISRKINSGNPTSRAFSITDWENKISDVVNIPKPVDMNISYTYDLANNLFDITVQNEIMIDHSGDYNIVYYIIENNVIGDQKLQDMSVDTNYSHARVLRDVLNTTWGELLFSGSTSAGTVIPHTIQYTPSSNIIGLNNCAIVAYLRELSTGEVIQAAKVDINGLLVGIDEAELDDAIIYPNPVSDELHINVNSNYETLDVIVTDELGRIILIDQISSSLEQTIDFSDVEAGSYILRVISVDGVSLSNKRIVKI